MKTLITSLKFTLAFCVLLFGGYVLVLWGVAAVVQPNMGEAEVVTMDGKVVGAANVGQQFTQDKYFWGRPSAVDYDGGASGGSNKGPSNEEYLQLVRVRIDSLLAAHPYLKRGDVPSELVTASGSGLDPHLSPVGAQVQIERVAKARGLSTDAVRSVVTANTKRPLIGQPYVNVLRLNVALDNMTNK